jgi:hypothetical protein
MKNYEELADPLLIHTYLTVPLQSRSNGVSPSRSLDILT